MIFYNFNIFFKYPNLNYRYTTNISLIFCIRLGSISENKFYYEYSGSLLCLKFLNYMS